MRVFVLLGAPGAGKGTIAAMLVEKCGVRHISSGDLLRAAVRDGGTPAAQAAAEAMRRGALVADDVAGELVAERLRRAAPDDIMLLDGYPRNVAQAKTLEHDLGAIGTGVEAVIWLEVPEAVLMERLAERRVCGKCAAVYHSINLKPRISGVCDRCGGTLVRREDDTPERVANRLEVFHRETEALLVWYEQRKLLRRIKAAPAASEVAESLAKMVKA